VALELAFTTDDVARTRLTFSALWETVLSIRAIKNPEYHALHLPWIRQVQPRFQESASTLALLSELIDSPRRIPDFLTPPRDGPVTQLNDDLRRLRAVKPAQVRDDLETFRIRRTRRVRELYDDPKDGLARLAGAIQDYWQWALEPHWPRIKRLLDGDIFYRAQQLAAGGAQLLFRDLHPQVAWHDNALILSHRTKQTSRSARGEGLLLTPSAFVWPRISTITMPPWQPTLVYPARGVAALWESGGSRTRAALAGVVGRTKALLLVQLETPATTTDLARRTGITTGGISQHLTALRNAGLVAANRDRNHVLYVRTILADALVEGAGPASAHG
jgi:DNA-binding transcriptional ArsR family regulator